MVLVSACLLGVKCTFEGACFRQGSMARAFSSGEYFPVCPEVLGGLRVPRCPAEIVNGDGTDVLEGRARVVTLAGMDVTDRFLAGARAVLSIAKTLGAKKAFLLETSPSCGSGKILDGSFTFRYREGDGVTAALLKREGIRVVRIRAPRAAVRRLSEEAAAPGRRLNALPGPKIRS